MDRYKLLDEANYFTVRIERIMDEYRELKSTLTNSEIRSLVQDPSDISFELMEKLEEVLNG